eukprot:gene7088-5022_t
MISVVPPIFLYNIRSVILELFAMDCSAEKLWIVSVCVFAATFYGLIFIFFLDALVGWAITLIARWFVFSKDTKFKVGSVIIAPLSGRVFFKGIFFQNQDVTVRVVDGYTTLALMYGSAACKRLHEDMISDDLLNRRCQVDSTLRRERGTIVAVDVKKKKVCVRLAREDTELTNGAEEDGDDPDEDSWMSSSDSAEGQVENWEDDDNDEFSPREQDLAESGQQRTGSGRQRHFQRPPVRMEQPAADPGSGGRLKWYTYSDVLLPQLYSRCRLHFNGMQVSVYNATGKYDELVAAVHELQGGDVETTEKETSEHKKFLAALKTHLKEKVLPSTSRHYKGEEELAQRIQKEQLESCTWMHQFFRFVKSVEVDIMEASVSIGGASSDFPFFLHASCQRASGSCYRTRNGCNPIDLYRGVFDFSFQNADLRIVSMQPDAVELVYQKKECGEHNEDAGPKKNFELLDDFGLILSGESTNAIHVLTYIDAPNIYAGEAVTHDTIPRAGIEVVLDVPFLRAGPWVEYCRMKLTEFFMPANYLPLKPLAFEIGSTRPRAPLDFVVTFLRTTTLEIPFKRPSPTLRPPFGIADSGEVGVISVRVGGGTEYIQRGAFMIGDEETQCLKMLLSGKDIEVSSNAVLGLPCQLAKVNSVQCFIDREEGKIWHQCKRWGFTVGVSNGSVNFNMSYVNFFLDIMNDWQFASSMYLGKPLNTDLFNTKERFIRDFIPQVRKFELIVENTLEVKFNVNHQNVIYSRDPFSPAENMLAKLKLSSGCFEMHLPADQYQLSSRNEVSRPLSVEAHNVDVYLSLPSTHPYYSAYDCHVPFGTIKRFEITGAFIINTPNQAVPQDPRAMLTMRSHLLLDITLAEVRANMRGCHIKAIVDFMENHFIDHSGSITPAELFWLFTALQSKVAFGTNKKKEWMDYLSSAFPSSFLESTITVALKDAEAILAKPVPPGTPPSPSQQRIEARTAEFFLVVLKQAAVQEINVSLTPVTLRWFGNGPIESPSPVPQNYQFPPQTPIPFAQTPRTPGCSLPGEPSGSGRTSFLTVGEVAFGFICHYGPLMGRGKVQEIFDLRVNGVMFDISSADVVSLVEILSCLKDELLASDKALEEELYRARFAAEQTFRAKVTNVSFSITDNMMGDWGLDGAGNGRENSVNERLPGQDMFRGNSPQQQDTREFPRGAHGATPSTLMNHAVHSQPHSFSALGSSSPNTQLNAKTISDIPIVGPNVLSNAIGSVPTSLVEGFAKLMAQDDHRESLFNEYGLVFVYVHVPVISGVLRFSDADLFWLQLPRGVQLESSSLNTLCATRQLSLRIKEVVLRGMRSSRCVCSDTALSAAIESARGPRHDKKEVLGSRPVADATVSPLDDAAVEEGCGKASTSPSRDELQYMVEVCHIRTGISVAHNTESTVDGSLAQHMKKQRYFVASQNYKKLIDERFRSVRLDSPRRRSYTAQRQHVPRSRQEEERLAGLPVVDETREERRTDPPTPPRKPASVHLSGSANEAPSAAPTPQPSTASRRQTGPNMRRRATLLLAMPRETDTTLPSAAAEDSQPASSTASSASLGGDQTCERVIEGLALPAIRSEASGGAAGQNQLPTWTATTELLSSRHFFSCESASASSMGSLHSSGVSDVPQNRIRSTSGRPMERSASSLDGVTPPEEKKVVNASLRMEHDSIRQAFQSFIIDSDQNKTRLPTPANSDSSLSSSTRSSERVSPPQMPQVGAGGEAEPPLNSWSYYSFFQRCPIPETSALRYNAHCLTAEGRHDKTAFSAPLPLVDFVAALPVYEFQDVYDPLPHESEGSDSYDDAADNSLLAMCMKGSEAFDSVRGYNNNSATVNTHDHSPRVASLLHQHHTLRQHISVECTTTLDVLATMEICPLIGELVTFSHLCTDAFAKASNSSQDEEEDPNMNGKTTFSLIQNGSKKAKTSARVFYKTRKPVILHVIVAKIPEVRLNVVGRQALSTEMLSVSRSRPDPAYQEESLIHLSLGAYNLNLSLQKRPGPSSATGSTKGQKLSIILEHSAIIGVSSIMGKNVSRGQLKVDIPSFKQRPVDRCVAGIMYVGQGGAMACVHTVPVHVAVSPLAFGTVGLHFTRDFSDTLLMLRSIGDKLSFALEKARQGSVSRSPAPCRPAAGREDSDDEADTLSSSTPNSPIRRGDVLQYDHGRKQFEGHITLQGISVAVYDIVPLPSDVNVPAPACGGSRRQQAYIMHHEPNTFEVGPSFVKISAKVERNYTSLKKLLYCVGSVGGINVKCFPSIVYILSSTTPVFNEREERHSTSTPTGGDTSHAAASGALNALRRGGINPVGNEESTKDHLEVVEMNLSCRFHNLEGTIKETAGNYMRLHIKDILVGHSSHNEEPRQAELFDISSLSLFTKTRLAYLAVRAKLRLLNCESVSRCATTARPLLSSTTTVSLGGVNASYHPNTAVDGNAQSSFLPLSASPHHLHDVLSINVKKVAVAFHVCAVPEIHNSQLNISGNVSGIKFDLPYTPHFGDVVYPQLQQFVFNWRVAVAESTALRLSKLAMQQASPPPASESARPSRRNSVAWYFFNDENKPAMSNARNKDFDKAPPGFAVWLAIGMDKAELRVGLDDVAVQVLEVPRVTLFVQASEQRWNVKTHVHPCCVFSGLGRRRDYEVGLPPVFVDFGGDEKKLAVTTVVGRMSATITSLMAHHSILAFHRVMEDIVPLLKPIPVEKQPIVVPIAAVHQRTSTLELMQHNRLRKEHVSLLICGGRVSCITQLTTLSLSATSLSAYGQSEPEKNKKQLDWKLQLIDAQIALTDHKSLSLKPVASGEHRSDPTNSAGSRVQETRGAPKPPAPIQIPKKVLSITNEQKGLDMIVKNTSFVAQGEDVRSAILSRVGESVSRWRFCVDAPKAVVRLGLPDVLKESLREAQQDLESYSKDSVEKKKKMLEYLETIEKFRMLKAQRADIMARIASAEKEHKENVTQAEIQVAQELYARVASNLKGREARDFWTNVKSQSRHTCVGTVSHLSVIVPIGDASYRRIVETLSYTVSQQLRKDAISVTLPRSSTTPDVFVPYFAMKFQVQRVSLLFSLQKADTSFQALIKQSLNRGQSPAGGTDKRKPPVHSTLCINGRLNAVETRLFFTSGSPLGFAPPPEQNIYESIVYGGQGVLTCFRNEEFRSSRNTVVFPSIGMPFNFKKTETINFSTVMDIAAPEVQVSPWIFVILSDIQKELPSKQHKHAVSRVKDTGVFPWQNRAQSYREPSKKSIFSSFSYAPKKKPEEEENAVPVLVDISARLDKGKLFVFSQTYGEEVYQPPSATKASKFDRVRAETGHRSSMHKQAKNLSDHHKTTGFIGTSFSIDHNSEDMVSASPIPLPSAVVQICGRQKMNDGDSNIIRAEVSAGEIILSPTLLMITEEIEKISSNYEPLKVHHIQALVKTIEEITVSERMRVMLQQINCTLLEAMLPTPVGYLSALQSNRYNVAALHQHNTLFGSQSIFDLPEPKRASITSVHLSIANFRIVLDTAPIHTTTFSVFLSDHGTIDILLHLEERQSTEGSGQKHPENTLIFHIHQLRAECQTRLEVKSVEMFLPELTLSMSKRQIQRGSVQTISLNLPLNLDTTEQNVLLRFQHLSQFFIVRQLWTRTLRDFLKVVGAIYERDTLEQGNLNNSCSLSGMHSHKGVITRSLSDGMLVSLQKDEFLFVVASIASGWLEVDLGGGNVHRVHTGSLNLGLENSQRQRERTTTYKCKVSLRDLVIKSDGLLSGSIRISEVLVMGYKIKNALLQRTFVRSKEGRTFRLWVLAHGISWSCKERHVKDVLELKADSILFQAMDGVSQDGYSLVDVNCDINTSKLRLTPSTMPAFLNLVYSLSVSLNERRANGAEKIRFASQAKQLPPYILHNLDWINQTSATEQSTQRSPTSAGSGPRPQHVLPFMGSAMERVPCGQLRLGISNTTFLLGVASGEEARSGSVVVQVPAASITFAECTSSNYKVVKRALRMTTENVELFRPLPAKSLIMGLKGTNVLEFYTHQRLGHEEVGFTLDLSQGHPWTGNPLYHDFAEIAELINHFIDNSNIQVLERIMKGDLEDDLENSLVEETTHKSPLARLDQLPHLPQLEHTPGQTGEIAAEAEEKREQDPRVFKPLRPAKFSPQLRFGGDISVNTEVILNWFGVTEKVLPRAIHCAIGDKLESDGSLSRTAGSILLYFLTLNRRGFIKFSLYIRVREGMRLPKLLSVLRILISLPFHAPSCLKRVALQSPFVSVNRNVAVISPARAASASCSSSNNRSDQLLIVDYGWERGKIPKFRARSPYHRQQIACRMVTEMIRKDYCIVGGARAPALRILADHVVELAKAGDTDSRQQLAFFLHDPLMVDKAFDEYPRRFRDMHSKYAMMTRLRSRRRSDGVAMYFVEFKNRDLSDNHKGEDYTSGPERFFLPPRIIETEKGIQRPPHMQMAFDRWASKYKTEEFHHWWRLRHAKLRFWGVRNVPHPSEVDPLWSEKEEEEWHNEMLANSENLEEYDLDDEEFSAAGEGGVTHGPEAQRDPYNTYPLKNDHGKKTPPMFLFVPPLVPRQSTLCRHRFAYPFRHSETAHLQQKKEKRKSKKKTNKNHCGIAMKRKTDVCGKPTQYNLQTLQYDWKELPDTHFAFNGSEPRRRGASSWSAPYATDDQNPPVSQPLRRPDDRSTKLQANPVAPSGYGYGMDPMGGAAGLIDYGQYMQWSHDDIRQMLRNNMIEASSKYAGVSA